MKVVSWAAQGKLSLALHNYYSGPLVAVEVVVLPWVASKKYALSVGIPVQLQLPSLLGKLLLTLETAGHWRAG